MSVHPVLRVLSAPSDEPEDCWLTSTRAAAYLDLSPRQFRKRVEQGALPYSTIPGSTRRRFSLLALHRLMKSRERIAPRRG